MGHRVGRRRLTSAQRYRTLFIHLPSLLSLPTLASTCRGSFTFPSSQTWSEVPSQSFVFCLDSFDPDNNVLPEVVSSLSGLYLHPQGHPKSSIDREGTRAPGAKASDLDTL
jgi:hypothetical protein